MDQNTTWRLKLQEMVSGPMRKLNNLLGYGQKQMSALGGSTDKLAKNSAMAGRELKRTTGSLSDLNSQLKKLQQLQDKAFDPKHILNYEKAIQKVQKSIRDSEKMRANIREQVAGKKKGIDWAAAGEELGMGRLMSLATNPMALAGAGIAAVGKEIFDDTKLAMEWQEGMAKINATALLSQDKLKELDQQLQKIGEDSNGQFMRIPASFEKILSVTGNLNQSMPILKAAIKGASAGFTDLDIVGKSVATTMSIIGNKATAQEVVDTFLKAKRIGAGEFEDFANYMPGLIASGRMLNMNWKQTAGIFSYLTQKTRDAADSTMLMKNFFTAMSKPDILNGLKAAKIQVFDKKGEMRRLDEILMDLEKKLGLATTKQKMNFFNNIGLHDAQAKEALQTLLADTHLLKQQIDGVNDSLGETNRQLIATGSAARNWKEVGDIFKSIKKDIGDFFLPMAEQLGLKLKEIFSLFKKETYTESFNYKDSSAAKKIDSQMIELAKNFAQNKLGQQKLDRKLTIKDVPAAMRTGDDKKDLKNYLKGIDDKAGADLFNNEFNRLKGMRELYNKNGMHDVAYLSDGSKHGGKVPVYFSNILNQLSDKKAYQRYTPPEGPIKKLAAQDKLFEENEKKKPGEGGGGNGGLKTLIQNLYITNKIETKEDQEKFKRKLTDDIVDAGRDGLVTLGI